MQQKLYRRYETLETTSNFKILTNTIIIGSARMYYIKILGMINSLGCPLSIMIHHNRSFQIIIEQVLI